MATYAAKSGGQNFTDTWALVDNTSLNAANPSTSGYVNVTASYVNSLSWTYASSAPTIDGIGIAIGRTNLQTSAFESTYSLVTGTFTVSLYNTTDSVEVAAVTCNVADLAPFTYNTQTTWYGGEWTTRARVQWCFFKFGSAVSLATGKNYVVRLICSVANEVSVFQVNGSNWMRYLRTTDTSASPTTGDRLFICGEITGAGATTGVTVTHDSTATTSYGKLEVGAYGSWVWGTSASTNYYFKTSDDIRICQLGTLQIGDPGGTRIPSTSTATIEFVATGANTHIFMCERKSTIKIGGQTKNHIAYLNSNVTTSNNSATVSLSKSSVVDPGWKQNDEVIFAPFAPDANTSSHWNKWDARFLTGDSASGAITLSTTSGGAAANFTYAHDTRVPYVANLTRNVKIIGASAANTFGFDINCDGFNIQSAELRFTDGFRIRTGDNHNISTLKNCVVKDGRNSTQATGIIAAASRSLYIDDCVISRASGFYSYVNANSAGGNNSGPSAGDFPPTEFTNCIAIGNSFNHSFYSNGYSSFTNCVGAGNTGAGRFEFSDRISGVSTTVAKNCWFGMANSSVILLGAWTGTANNSGNLYINTDLRYTFDSCTFYANVVDVNQTGFIFESCTFQRPYATTYGWFLSFNTTDNNSRFDRTFDFNYFNNCGFLLDTPGGTNNLFNHDGGLTRAVFNSCTFNAAFAHIQNYDQELTFNNCTANYWTLYKEYTAVGVAFNSINLINSINTHDNSKLCFVNLNGATNESLTFTISGGFRSDAVLYDSSPRSLKIWSNKAGTGFNGPKIKVPLKTNASATVTMKMKLSEHNIAEGTFADNNRSFYGMVPSLVIRANRSLGSNYASEQEIWPSDISAINGSPSVAGFDPTSLGSNLKLWCNSDSLSNFTYDSYNRVSQWSDSSGNNNHLTQSTDSKKPILSTSKIYNFANTIAGKTGLKLNGKKDERLFCNSNILGTTTAENEIFAVMMTNTGAGNVRGSSNYSRVGNYFGYSSNHTINAAGSGGAGSGFNGGVAVYNGTNNRAGIVTYPYNELLTLVHVRNSVANSQIDIRINNYLETRATTNIPNITPTQFSVGVPEESTATLIRASHQSYIYELVVVNRRMTSTEVDDMSKYLANKFKIALRQRYTSWVNVSYNIPAVSMDSVVEATINLKGMNNIGWVNIDSITVT